MIVAGICKRGHGFYKGERCDKCAQEIPKSTVHINTYDWIKQGVWEHIDPLQPNMRLNSKEDLIRECEKRNLIPRAFQKTKSSAGPGYTVARKGYNL